MASSLNMSMSLHWAAQLQHGAYSIGLQCNAEHTAGATHSLMDIITFFCYGQQLECVSVQLQPGACSIWLRCSAASGNSNT